MKLRKKDIVILFISFFLIIINFINYQKNQKYSVMFSNKLEIAKPIFVLEKDEKIERKIKLEDFPMEYNFVIKNYDENFVNEIDFDYTIEIQSNAKKFPISYYLFDCNNNKDINLIDGKSEILSLDKLKKVDRKFKLCLEWKELDCELDNEIEINLKINAVQKEV